MIFINLFKNIKQAICLYHICQSMLWSKIWTVLLTLMIFEVEKTKNNIKLICDPHISKQFFFIKLQDNFTRFFIGNCHQKLLIFTVLPSRQDCVPKYVSIHHTCNIENIIIHMENFWIFFNLPTYYTK